MNQADQQFSTQKITPQLITQIIDALKNKAFGSVEIYIENFSVTQITERTITKVARRNNVLRKMPIIKSKQVSTTATFSASRSQ